MAKRPAVLCKRCCSHTTLRPSEICDECLGGIKFSDPVTQRARPASGDIVFKAFVGATRPKAEPTSDAEDDEVSPCPKCGKKGDECKCDKKPRDRGKLPNRGAGQSSAATPRGTSAEAIGVEVRSLEEVAAGLAKDLAPGIVKGLARGVVGSVVVGIAAAVAQATRHRGR